DAVCQRRTIDQLHHKRTDAVSFFDRDIAFQFVIARAVDLARAARSDGCDDLVRPELRSRRQHELTGSVIFSRAPASSRSPRPASPWFLSPACERESVVRPSRPRSRKRWARYRWPEYRTARQAPRAESRLRC